MAENHKAKRSVIASPLAIIALFVSLTEVVSGIAVTQATGGVQMKRPKKSSLTLIPALHNQREISALQI